MKLRLSLTSKFEKMAHRFAWMRWIFTGYYRFLTYFELKHLTFNQQSRVLCIGGGALPETACFIHHRTNFPVDVIDLDPIAIEQMDAYFARYAINDIKAKLAEGQRIDISDYQIIHVAKQVMPKDQVITHIESQLRIDQVLIVRRCLLEKLQHSLRKVRKPC